MKLISLALLLPLCAHAAAPTDDPVTTLDPVTVKETPFAKWGMSITTQVNFLSGLTGNWSPPRIPYVVASVSCNSPADIVGIHAGDQIIAVNGIGFKKLPFREFNELFEKSESGHTLTLLLSHPITNQQRTVTIKLDSGRKWLSPDRVEWNYWGLKFIFPTSLKVSGTIDLPPLQVQAVTLEWSGEKITLVEHPGQGVEVIDGAYSQRKLRKRKKIGEPTGRMVRPGAVLTLKPGGEYELIEGSER